MENKEDKFPVLLERKLKYRKSSNVPEIDVTVEIGHPYWSKPGVEAACPVAIRGAIGRVRDIKGEDPIYAMKSAIAFLDNYLDRSDREDKFYWLSGEEFSKG